MPIAASHKALDEYYHRLAELHGQRATYEQATRAAFQMLLTALAQPAAKWTLEAARGWRSGERRRFRALRRQAHQVES